MPAPLAPEDLPASRFVDVVSGRSFYVDLPGSLQLGQLARPGPAVVDALSDALASAFATSGGGGAVGSNPVNGLRPVKRTQPTSDARLGRPFQKIVGDQWRKYVLDRPSQDVVVMYYDPHCGHCAKLQPELEELAALAFDDHKLHPRGNLGMLQLDVTSNDPNDGEWAMPSGVPVVHLYPAVCSPVKAKQKLCPQRNASDFVAFSGGPAKPEIIAFVEEHAKYSPVWTKHKGSSSSSSSSNVGGEL